MGQASLVTAEHLSVRRPSRGARVASLHVETGLGRRELLRLGAACAALLAVAGALLLVTQGGREDASTQRQAEGVISELGTTKHGTVVFALRPLDGGRARRFDVRATDTRQITLQHLEQHLRDLVPVRITYEAAGGTAYVTGLEDVPRG